MLNAETPFPNVGSYALYQDPDLPESCRTSELVRLLSRLRNGEATVSFPLRDGASGTKTVPAANIIDATDLNAEETRELHDCEREIRGRDRLTPKQRKARNRAEALRVRLIFSRLLRRRMAALQQYQARKAAAA